MIVQILKEDEMVKNQFFITVSKTSELNAIQLSNLFYETDLFASVQSTFMIINLPGGECEDKRILEVLKDEPAIIRTRCFDHLGWIDGFYFELQNSHSEFFSLTGVCPLEEIPKPFRKDGLSVCISGNVISYAVVAGCSEPNTKLAYTHLFEMKSIKINN